VSDDKINVLGGKVNLAGDLVKDDNSLAKLKPNVIDITRHLKDAKIDAQLSKLDKAFDFMESLSTDEFSYVIMFIIEVIRNEVSTQLARRERGEPTDENALIFKEVDAVYAHALASGCFFCDPSVDPNEKIDKIQVCFACAHKLKKLGVDVL